MLPIPCSALHMIVLNIKMQNDECATMGSNAVKCREEDAISSIPQTIMVAISLSSPERYQNMQKWE